MPIGQEKGREVRGSRSKVGFDGLYFVLAHGVDARERVLQAVDPDSVLLHVDIINLQQSDLRSPEAVTIGEKKQRAVSLIGDPSKQPAEFRLREIGDGAHIPGSPAAWPRAVRLPGLRFLA